MNSGRFLPRFSFLLQATLFAGVLTLWIPEPNGHLGFELAIFALGLVWLLAVALRRCPFFWSRSGILLASIALWPLVQLSCSATVYRWNTVDAFWRWVANTVCFWLAFQIAAAPHRLLQFLRATLYFAFGLSAISTIQMFTSHGRVFWFFATGYSDFVLGPFVYRNQYAAFIELTLPVALFFALFSRKNVYVYSGMAAVMVASVIASASRAGTILVVAETFAIPLTVVGRRMGDRNRVGSVLSATAAVAIVAVAVFGYNTVWQRFADPDPLFLRREVLISSARMLADKVGMGFGLGTWAQAYPAYATFEPGSVINQAHNDWLQWAVEGGLPFLGLLLWTFGLVVRPAVRSVWGIGILVVLLHCFVDYPLQQRPAFACLFFALIGAVCAGHAAIDRAAARSRGNRRDSRSHGFSNQSNGGGLGDEVIADPRVHLFVLFVVGMLVPQSLA